MVRIIHENSLLYVDLTGWHSPIQDLPFQSCSDVLHNSATRTIDYPGWWCSVPGWPALAQMALYQDFLACVSSFFAGSWSFRALKASMNTSNFTHENEVRGKIYQEPGKRGSKWSQNFVNSFLWQWSGIENAAMQHRALQHRAFGQALQELTRITSVDILKGTRSDAGRVRKDTGGIHESVKRLASASERRWSLCLLFWLSMCSD